MGTSFVNHVSFEIMAREGIGIAFAVDADFVSAGVSVLPEPG
jgi:predicted nucleic acid-binding protein